MKYVATSIIGDIKVESNGASASQSQWLRIRDVKTGKILHTGQPAYIKRIAEKRYNRKIELCGQT